MTIRAPYAPHYGTNQVVTAGAASVSITIGAGNKSLLICNTGANIAYIRVGRAADGTVTATTADCPIPVGQMLIISKPHDHDTLAHIAAASTTLQIMSGEGGY